jgi:hypothetical protein
MVQSGDLTWIRIIARLEHNTKNSETYGEAAQAMGAARKTKKDPFYSNHELRDSAIGHLKRLHTYGTMQRWALLNMYCVQPTLGWCTGTKLESCAQVLHCRVTHLWHQTGSQLLSCN